MHNIIIIIIQNRLEPRYKWWFSGELVMYSTDQLQGIKRLRFTRVRKFRERVLHVA